MTAAEIAEVFRQIVIWVGVVGFLAMLAWEKLREEE